MSDVIYIKSILPGDIAVMKCRKKLSATKTFDPESTHDSEGNNPISPQMIPNILAEVVFRETDWLSHVFSIHMGSFIHMCNIYMDEAR